MKSLQNAERQPINIPTDFSVMPPLESPVLLLSDLAEPSPTTGKQLLNLDLLDCPGVSEKRAPASTPARAEEKPVEDGYNWRKYGQKHTAGSLFPRSYYKCTHPGCQVKKKVERSEIGLVTSCVYRGEHNHPHPSTTPDCVVFMEAATNGVFELPGDASTIKSGGTESSGPSQFVSDSGEVSGGAREPFAAVRGAEVAAAFGEEVAGAAKRTAEDDGAESPAKRQKVDCNNVAATPPNAPRLAGALMQTPAVATPAVPPALPYIRPGNAKLVVKTRSEVDVLNDSYRWRKYGQKLVKGNPYPRSYYKCTIATCGVRKHVERSADDPGIVVTTYEGIHSHAAPSKTTGRNKSKRNNAAASRAAAAPPAPVPTPVVKPEQPSAAPAVPTALTIPEATTEAAAAGTGSASPPSPQDTREVNVDASSPPNGSPAAFGSEFDQDSARSLPKPNGSGEVSSLAPARKATGVSCAPLRLPFGSASAPPTAADMFLSSLISPGPISNLYGTHTGLTPLVSLGTTPGGVAALDLTLGFLSTPKTPKSFDAESALTQEQLMLGFPGLCC